MSNPHKDWLIQEQTALGKDISKPLMACNLPKIVWFLNSPYPIKRMSWLARKIMACGKGSEKTIIGNQLTKMLTLSIKSWLVQKQTASGKDYSNPLTAGGLLKITRLSGVPQFSHLATPEVMAFGKET